MYDKTALGLSKPGLDKGRVHPWVAAAVQMIAVGNIIANIIMTSFIYLFIYLFLDNSTPNKRLNNTTRK